MKNNTIALLIGVLIVISVASILAGPKQITRFGGVTGHATGDSYVLFNMSSEVSVLVAGNIEFGSGRINTGSAYADLDSSLGYYNFSFTNITSSAGQTPPSRGAFKMVFDSNRNVSVLYGGNDGLWPSTKLNETWEFNHSTKTWLRITSADESAGGIPGYLINYAVSYDSQNEVAILFGGENNSGKQNRTWEYDGVSWTELSPSTAPSPRKQAVMAFDSLRNVSVLFGGNDDSGNSFETWEYNYSSNNWTNISTASSPAVAVDTFMIFDPVIGKMIFSEGTTGQIWEYDGSDWTVISSNIGAEGGPSGTFAGPMGYDSGRNKSLWMEASVDSGWYFTAINFWEYSYAENRWFEIRDFEIPKNFGVTTYDSNAKEALVFMTIPSNIFASLVNLTMNETWILNYTPSGLASNSSWDVYKDYMFIENDGTVNISVNYTADNDASAFVGGTSPGFMVKGVVDQAGACDNLVTTYAEISSSVENNLCDVLHYTNLQDTFRVAVKLKVPSDVNAGTHNSTITFTGRAVS